MGKRSKKRWTMQEGTVFRRLTVSDLDAKERWLMRRFLSAPGYKTWGEKPLLLVSEDGDEAMAMLVDRKAKRIAFSAASSVRMALAYLEAWIHTSSIPWEPYDTDQLEMVWDDFWKLVSEETA